jgi:hypothetical protein
MPVTFKVNGLKEIQVQIKTYTKELEKRADEIIEDNVRQMVQRAKRDAPKDFGTLQNSITAKKISPSNWAMVAQAAHAVYIEFGTKGRYRPIPGVDPKEFKAPGDKNTGKGFYDSILDWVKRNGIAGTYSTGYLRYEKGSKKKGRRLGSSLDKQLEDEQAAFAIYLSIMRHGIKPHPFFFKQQEEQEKKLYKDLQDLINNEQRL